jgi:hypothetical protein
MNVPDREMDEVRKDGRADIDIFGAYEFCRPELECSPGGRGYAYWMG